MEFVCDVCGEHHEQGRGRPRKYCPPAVAGERSACEQIGEALPVILRALHEGRPQALIHVLEKLEDVEVPRAAFTEAQVRRMRGAAFRLASRGRRLAPGTSGKYARKNGRDDSTEDAAVDAVVEGVRRAPVVLPSLYRRLNELASDDLPEE